MSHRSLIGVVLLIFGAGFVGCRGGNEPSPSTPPASTPTGTDPTRPGDPDPTATAMLIHIVETNTDTFPRRLADAVPEPPDPPFELEEGVIRLDPRIANETDPKKLQSFALTLGSADTPLNQCKVFVIYSTVYRGVGREWDEQSYFAYKSLPSNIEVPKAERFEKFEYDFAKAEEPFVFAVQNIRIFDELPGTIELQLDGESLKAAYAEKSHPLPVVQAVKLCDASRSLSVVELPLVAEPGKGEGPKLEIRGKIDHGSVKFSTELSITHLGRFSIRTKPQKPPEEVVP